jgi:hypothetical protein
MTQAPFCVSGISAASSAIVTQTMVARIFFKIESA